MPNALAPIGRQRAITDLGIIAPGALLHTYVSGTPNTPLATTADAAGTVPNANPLVASAGGLFGPIYLPPGVAYHFVLTDAGGLPLWDQDPVMAGGTAGVVTGDLTLNGILTVTGFGTHLISAGGTGGQVFSVVNSAAGAGNFAQIGAVNNTNQAVFLRQFASNFASTSVSVANGSLLQATGPGGLGIATSDAAAALRFHTGGAAAERMRIAPTGELLVNLTTTALAGQVSIASDLVVHQALGLQNTNPANSGNFLVFFSSAGASAGNITQTGATSVVYGTTSDARLKDDDGPVTDLAALRAIRVHDFRWKADGIRDRGVFAQEAHALYPRAVVAGTDARTADGALARPWMTDYSKFMPDVIVGWQQHDATIADLRAAVARLEAAR